MTHEYRCIRRIEFADTDMAGIGHFSAFFRFMEAAEHDFYRSLGFELRRDAFERSFGLPRVHASCDYSAPIRFEDQLEIHLMVRRKGRTSLDYVFVFVNDQTGEDVARGELTVVHVARDVEASSFEPAPLPAALRDTIGVAPPESIPPRRPR